MTDHVCPVCEGKGSLPRRLTMQKWMHALMLGMEILSDVEKMLLGQATSFTFIWGNKSFTVTFTPVTPPTPNQ